MTSANIFPEHQQHLIEELGVKGLDLAIACGVRSLTEVEAAAMGFRLQGQSSSGLMFPFGETFMQLRCDKPPLDADGEPAKYLSLAGSRQDVAIFGPEDATIATEGWKDGAALHLASAETVAAIAGVHSWHLMPSSIRLLIYDADAAQNPYVWGPLLLAGAARSHLRLAFFDAAIAGPKGGACEYFRNGGTLEAIDRFKPRALLDRIPDGLSLQLRSDWHRPSIAALVRAAVALGLSETARAALVKRAYRRLQMEKAHAMKIEAATLEAISREKAEAEGIDYDAKRAAAESAKEPISTYDRNRRLLAAIGHEWQADYDDRHGWRRWTGTHWSEVRGDDTVLGEFERFFDVQGWEDRERTTFVSLLAAFRRAIDSVPATPVPGLLPFRNGCLELVSGALRPHDPAHGNSWSLDYDYDPAATCPGIETFLLDRLEDPASVAVYRAFAWHLLHGRRPKAFLEITGSAETGKSVLANLLTALVGREASEAGTLERLEDRRLRFETIRFRGKRLAIFNECQRYSGPLEMLKTFTGGDAVAAERKGSTAAVSFVFHGGVVLVGNGSVRPSDVSGAVINRRRSLFVRKVIASSDARVMLEADGSGWRGELASELPGFARWVLAMTEAEACAALARDVPSRARAEAKLEALFDTDVLAEWADECLVWDPAAVPARIGSRAEPPALFLLPNYRKWIEDREGSGAYGEKNFKRKLLELLRSLGLPMPPGSYKRGNYRVRGVGSVMPCIRFRDGRDPAESPGVITYAVMAEAMVASREWNEGEVERERNDESSLGNGWNGSEKLALATAASVFGEGAESGREAEPDGLDGVNAQQSVPAVPPVPRKGFHSSSAMSNNTPPVSHGLPGPSQACAPVLVDGREGWSLPGVMPRSCGPTHGVLLVSPNGASCRIERRRISLPGDSSTA